MTELFERVRKLMFSNMYEDDYKPFNVHYCYTKPAHKRYPFQFFWDTCLHIVILTALGEYKHAKMHLESLFALQEENGFVGNIIYWEKLLPGRFTDLFQMKPSKLFKINKPHMSDIIQPPMAALALLQIYEKTNDIDFVKKLLPKLKKYFFWLEKNRDFDNDGLISIISSFESGMDWKPTFDKVVGYKESEAEWKLFYKIIKADAANFIKNYNMSRIAGKGNFRVKDAGFNTIYALNLKAMAHLCRLTYDPDHSKYYELADKVTRGMINLMYDEDDCAFYDVFGKNNKKIKVLTPTIFFPLLLKEVPDVTAKCVIEKHLFSNEEFQLPYPVPSLAKSEKSFDPHESIFIWRGPTWVLNNWFINKILIDRGYFNQSDAIVRSTLSLISKSGFREYYNPFTGEGYGAEDFTWSGLVVDMVS